jgi:hypothetical protein
MSASGIALVAHITWNTQHTLGFSRCVTQTIEMLRELQAKLSKYRQNSVKYRQNSVNTGKAQFNTGKTQLNTGKTNLNTGQNQFKKEWGQT